MSTIGAADYIVGSTVLMVPLMVGFFFAYRDSNKENREEYLLGGRSMSLIPVSLSMLISFQSALSLIGVPMETMMYGSMNFFLYVGASLNFAVGAVAMVPLMYPLRLTSVFEYIEMRFNSKTTRMICVAMGMVFTTVYMAFALLAPSLALEATVGLPLWISVLIFGLIGTLYTAIGGIKSVIWTDTFQTAIVYIGILAMIITGTMEVGGISEVWNIASKGGRLDVAVTAMDPRVRDTYIGTLLGGTIMWLPNSFTQCILQRVASLETVHRASLALLLNVPMNMLYGTVLVILGNVIYAYYAHKQCDPLMSGLITNGNQICPYFVVETLGHIPGVVGLYVSILCCGSLSTLSSGINSLAANTVEDLLARPLASFKEKTITVITKVLAFGFGILIIALAIFAKSIDGPVNQITGMITSALGVPLTCVFLMGGMVPWANKYGVVTGSLAGLVFMLSVNVGRYFHGRPYDTKEPIPSGHCFDPTNSSTDFTQTNYISFSTSNYTSPTATAETTTNVVMEQGYGFFFNDMSYQFDGIFGTIVIFVVGLLVSYFTRSLSNSGTTTERRLIIPIFRRFWTLDSKESREPCEDKMETDSMLKDSEQEV